MVGRERVCIDGMGMSCPATLDSCVVALAAFDEIFAPGCCPPPQSTQSGVADSCKAELVVLPEV